MGEGGKTGSWERYRAFLVEIEACLAGIVFWVACGLFEGLQGFKLRKSLCLRQAVVPQLRAGGNEGFDGRKVVFGHPVTGAHQALCAFLRIIGAGGCGAFLAFRL